MDDKDNGLEEKCLWCNKPRRKDPDWAEHKRNIQEIRNSFSYHIAGQEVTKEEHDYIAEKQGYVSKKVLNFIKRKNALWKEFFPGIKRPF